MQDSEGREGKRQRGTGSLEVQGLLGSMSVVKFTTSKVL